MIYPNIALEKWINKYKLEVAAFFCPNCGKTFRTEVPIIMKNYVGLESPVHSCGKDFTKLVVTPRNEDEMKFWEETIG